MGFIPRLARSFGLVLLVAGGAAQAEVMHMPFDCRFDGARVHLRPSQERTYAIIGRHEREIFTACSPSDPGTCRNWFVHRFDFDCGGDRVAWIDAAAAVSRFSDWDAWIDNGRFQMRMNPLWGVARARPLGPRGRWMRRRFRDREDAFDGGPDGYGPRVVTVRPGFAPAVGIPLTFSGGAPDAAEVSEAPVQEVPAVAAYTAETVRPPAPELPVRAPTREERLAVAAPEPVVAPAPKPATKVATTQEAPAAPSATEPPSTQAKASGDTPSAAKTAGFTIINGPHAASSEPASPTPPAEEPAPSSAPAPLETAAVTAPAESAKATPPETQTSEPTAGATPEPATSDAVTSELAPQSRTALLELSPETVVAAAATTLALLVLAGFGIGRWRRGPSGDLPVNRDIADITFDGDRKAAPLALERASVSLDAPAAEASGAQASEDANALPVPTTYAEALEILGASPDASTSAIKKIVDGLRQSWHPDLARSESDRRRREARVRQINVAWDLVSQRRSAA